MTVPVFDYSADVVLRDGSTIHLRPIRSDDDVRLLDLLHRMSAEALYYRFLSVPRIDHDKAKQLVRVDPDHQSARPPLSRSHQFSAGRVIARR